MPELIRFCFFVAAMSVYIAIRCKVTPVNPFAEILIAQLADIGFEMFEENDNGFDGYIRKEHFHKKQLNEIDYLQENDFCNVIWQLEEIESINWNEEWERNFTPVEVKGVYIRAPFHHEKKDIKMEIIIQPKMSFGTGHHATTAMMIEQMLEIDFKKKEVLDMGCGSGILSIAASKMGAESVTAIDNDPNCVLNSIENIETNKTKNIHVTEGDADSLSGMKFDIILANINRNILLRDIEQYVKAMKPDAILLVSGFLKEDEAIITSSFSKLNLQKIKQLYKGDWSAVLYKR